MDGNIPTRSKDIENITSPPIGLKEKRRSFHGGLYAANSEAIEKVSIRIKCEDTTEEESLSSEEDFSGSTPSLIRRTSTLSNREVTNLSIFSYILCIRTSIQTPREILDSFSKEHYSKVDLNYIFPLGTTTRLKMREYAGDVFEKIRSITTVREDFLSSWSRPAETAMSLSTGKSRAKFFFSKDKKYLVKTLNIQETRWLLKILPAYLEHLEKNPNTLISKFFGLYCLTSGKKRSYFTILENVLDSNVKIDEYYDLKGSAVGRSRRERRNSKSFTSKEGALLDKDLRRKIKIGPKLKSELIEQLKIDAQFLCSQRLMDYSLLLGIVNEKKESNSNESIPTERIVYFTNRSKKPTHKDFLKDIKYEPIPKAPAPLKSCMKRKKYDSRFEQPIPENPIIIPPQNSKFSVLDGNQNEVYYLGIIDILQKFDSKKKIAGFAKSLKYNEEVSTVAPSKYSKRFIRFLDSIIE